MIMENFTSFLTSSAVLIAGIIFLRFNARIAKALDESEAVFWKSLNLFKQYPQRSILVSKILIFVIGLVLLISGILSLFMSFVTVFNKK